MPESKKRKQPVRTPSTPGATARKKKGPSPVWLAPLMLTMFGIGILWLVVFYLTEGDMPVLSSLQNGHLLVGFGFIVLGFILSTQWR
ncbi:MAG: rane protein [Frankiales bacterium]|nr:rane protein [Frankiales bacterium]